MITTRVSEATAEERWNAFPRQGLPLEYPVQVRWNEYMVPYIRAESDEDLAFTLGLVHTHLRWGQLETLRYVSQGRLAEVVGPLAAKIDHGLRVLDFSKAAPEIIAGLRPATRRWLERFVEGINWYQEHATETPVDLRALDVDRIPWTLQDLVGVWRLTGTDVNWLYFVELLRLRDQPGFDAVWRDLNRINADSLPSFPESWQADLANSLTVGASKSGSNSLVVSAARSQSGAPLMANDPHLGLALPNLWLLVGYSSPSYQVVGFMLPGVPFMAVGRNPRVAWGGTNMRSLSSYLFDLEEAEVQASQVRRERIKVRWWFDKEITVRDSQYGPIITDIPQFKGSGDYAMRWVGHSASDEVSAFLGANRANHWDEFRQAFESYAVSGQNILYADVDGNIGMLLAYAQPLVGEQGQNRLALSTSENWSEQRSSLELPSLYNPPEGYIASANNEPLQIAPRIGRFYSSNDRIKRLNGLLGTTTTVSVKALKQWQRDVYSQSSFELKAYLVNRCEASEGFVPASAEFWKVLRGWDGSYSEKSRGAVAFEVLMANLVPEVLNDHYASPDLSQVMMRGGRWKVLLRDLLPEWEGAELHRLVNDAILAATGPFADYPVWGDMHRMRLAHPLGRIPVLGRQYRFLEYGVGGSTETLMKTANGLSQELHYATYGANARHISDLSDLDANYFVLLGGQDGWLTGPNLIDQVPLWREGRYIQMPLRPESVERDFSRVMELKPAASQG